MGNVIFFLFVLLTAKSNIHRFEERLLQMIGGMVLGTNPTQHLELQANSLVAVLLHPSTDMNYANIVVTEGLKFKFFNT